jgi:hypothetical protein
MVPFSSSKGRACTNPVRFLKTQCSFMRIISKPCEEEEVCTKFATKTPKLCVCMYVFTRRSNWVGFYMFGPFLPILLGIAPLWDG